MKSQKFRLVFFIAIVLFLTTASYTNVGPTYAIVGCKIFPVTGPSIDKGVIIIRNGLIEALGPQGKVVAPEDAEVFMADGLFAYPGLIDAHTKLFLETPRAEPPSTRGRTQSPQPGARPLWQKSDFLAYEHLKPKKSSREKFHKIGITTVLVAPEKEIFAGQSVLMNINGEEKSPMVVQNPFALHINFTSARGAYPTSVMGAVALLKQSFLDTEHYSKHKQKHSDSPRGIKRPEYDPFLEGLIPYVVHKKPVVFNCSNQEDIKRALRIIDEFKLNGFISGANEAWRVINFLKRSKKQLFVTLKFKPPSTSRFVTMGEELKKKAEKEIYPANPANLYKNGIKFALTSQGITKPDDILKNIKAAIKAGLPTEEALKAMTVNPAEMLGIDHLLGTLEPGKIANIILTSGEIFGEKTTVNRVFVDGISFEVKQPAKSAKSDKTSAVNITGKWKAQVSGPMGELEMTITFEQDGSQVSGSVFSEMGNWTISSGRINGSDLSFSISATIMNQAMELEFSGKVENDNMEGAISFTGGSAQLRATKIPDVLI